MSNFPPGTAAYILKQVGPIYAATKDSRHSILHIKSMVGEFIRMRRSSPEIAQLDPEHVVSMILLHDVWLARRSLIAESTLYVINSYIDGIGSALIAKKYLPPFISNKQRLKILLPVLRHGSIFNYIPGFKRPKSREGRLLIDIDAIELVRWERIKHVMGESSAFKRAFGVTNLITLWFFHIFFAKTITVDRFFYDESKRVFLQEKEITKNNILEIYLNEWLPKIEAQPNAKQLIKWLNRLNLEDRLATI